MLHILETVSRKCDIKYQSDLLDSLFPVFWVLKDVFMPSNKANHPSELIKLLLEEEYESDVKLSLV